MGPAPSPPAFPPAPRQRESVPRIWGAPYSYRCVSAGSGTLAAPVVATRAGWGSPELSQAGPLWFLSFLRRFKSLVSYSHQGHLGALFSFLKKKFVFLSHMQYCAGDTTDSALSVLASALRWCGWGPDFTSLGLKRIWGRIFIFTGSNTSSRLWGTRGDAERRVEVGDASGWVHFSCLCIRASLLAVLRNILGCR